MTMSLPYLQPISSQQKSDCEIQVSGLRIHRKEMAFGWSGLLLAYTVGEALFFFQGQEEQCVLMPYDFAPHTISPEVFHDWHQRIKPC